MAKRKKSSWPKLRFLKTGSRLSASTIRKYPAQLTDGLQEFLAWRNGGVPELDSFVFNGPGGKNTIARVRSLNGIQTDENDGVVDIASAILSHWHDLPRGSIPFGDIDVSGHDFEFCTLVTFLWGERRGKVYFFDNPHDQGPLDPDDPTRLTLLANSPKQFIKTLKSFEAFFFREVFQLDCDQQAMAAIEKALCRAGTDEFSGDPITSRKKINRYANWIKRETSVYLAAGSKEIYWVPLPKELPSDRCYLAVNVSKWNRTKILTELKAVLKSVPQWKGAKLVARTPMEPKPYWRR